MLDACRSRLNQARHVVVLTGAGMSQESGLPVYRNAPDSLWNQHAMREIATAEALANNPQQVWLFLRTLAQQIAASQPHAGHSALAHLEQHRQVTIITQNVDNLHERAGSKTVLHLHGSVFSYRCASCAIALNAPEDHLDDWGTLIKSNPSAHRGGQIRHDVVLFDEMLDKSRHDQARQAIRDCDVVLVVGTSNNVYPAAE